MTISEAMSGSNVGLGYNPNPSMPPQDFLDAMRAEEESRRKAMPIRLNVTEAKGGWIISGDAYNTLDRQVVVTSIDEAVNVLRDLMTRES